MTHHMEKPLAELAKEIVADGIVDVDEIKLIRERVYADGVVDREEGDFLFAINDAVSGNSNDPGWKALFVEAILKHILEDEQSPGAVDEEEAAWLISKIQADNQVDDTERAMLLELKAKASSLPDSLLAKYSDWNV